MYNHTTEIFKHTALFLYIHYTCIAVKIIKVSDTWYMFVYVYCFEDNVSCTRAKLLPRHCCDVTRNYEWLPYRYVGWF